MKDLSKIKFYCIAKQDGKDVSYFIRYGEDGVGVFGDKHKARTYEQEGKGTLLEVDIDELSLQFPRCFIHYEVW